MYYEKKYIKKILSNLEILHSIWCSYQWRELNRGTATDVVLLKIKKENDNERRNYYRNSEADASVSYQ